MPISLTHPRDKGFLIRTAVILGALVGGLFFWVAQNLGLDREQISPQAVWDYIHEVAPQQGIDPEFVYALAWAESSLDARARSSDARGMMQLTRPAWREVSDSSYRFAWDWKTNIRVAVDYLAFCKEFLQQHDSFSYPLLGASYRYGLYYVKKNNFDLGQLKQPENEIYKRIFRGVIRPVEGP